MESCNEGRRWRTKPHLLANIPAIPVLAIKHPGEDVDAVIADAAPSSSSLLDRHYAKGEAAVSDPSFMMQNSYQSVSRPDDGASSVEESFVSDSPTLYHVNSEYCQCPMCRLTLYISYVYRDQRRASPHVMAARPSPDNAPGSDKSLPALPPLYKPSNVDVCPVFACHGFCPFHKACFLPHDVASAAEPRVPRLGTTEAELHRLLMKGEELKNSDVWACEVCGYDAIDEFCEVALGTEHAFRQCPRCTFMCYFPYVTYLVENILSCVGDDYQLYKNEIDRCRALLPDLFKIPLTYEAHRAANVVFGWSLVSPEHVRDAMNAVVHDFPEVNAVISMGSGAGYTEHVLNRVMHDVPLLPEWAVDRDRFSRTSFDDVRCDFYGQRTIPIFAFDALALRGTYSVHVSIGGPVSIYSLHCSTSVLLLSWPPFGSREREESSMGFEALEYFTREGGQVFIYIGDTAATGDWRFHTLLKSHYKLVRAYPVRRELRRWCPQEMGFVYGGNDTIGVYRLRDVPLSTPGFV